MNLYLKIILIIFGLAYLISPFDIIPDLFLPYIGWIDDGVIIAALIYLIRTGRLPDFLFKKTGRPGASFKQASNRNHRQKKRDKAEQSATGSNSRHQKKSRSPYDILGVRPGASKKEIQRAYKEAIKKYHPDKLSHLGEEFSTLANEKFLEIQDAYDILMKNFE